MRKSFVAGTAVLFAAVLYVVPAEAAPPAATELMVGPCEVVLNPTPAEHTACGGEELAGLKFAGLDLSYANFYRADLHGANLWGTFIFHTNLDGANLQNANLPAGMGESEIQGASFSHTAAAPTSQSVSANGDKGVVVLFGARRPVEGLQLGSCTVPSGSTFPIGTTDDQCQVFIIWSTPKDPEHLSPHPGLADFSVTVTP